MAAASDGVGVTFLVIRSALELRHKYCLRLHFSFLYIFQLQSLKLPLYEYVFFSSSGFLFPQQLVRTVIYQKWGSRGLI